MLNIIIIIVIVIVIGIFMYSRRKENIKLIKKDWRGFRPWVRPPFTFPWHEYHGPVGPRFGLFHILRDHPYLTMPPRNKFNKLIDLMDRYKDTLWRVKRHADGVQYIEYDPDFHKLAFKDGINPAFLTRYEDLILQTIRYRYK